MDIRIITGRLGADAEQITIAEALYLKAPIAVDNFGQTNWLDLIIADRGQKRNQYLTAGRAVEAWGRSTVRAYVNKDGQPGARETLWVDSWKLAETNWPQEKSQERPQLSRPGSVQDAESKRQKAEEDYNPKDLPF